MTAEPRQKCLKTPVPAAEAAIGRLGEVLGLVMSGRHPLIKGFFAALRLIVGAVMSAAC